MEWEKNHTQREGARRRDSGAEQRRARSDRLKEKKGDETDRHRERASEISVGKIPTFGAGVKSTDGGALSLSLSLSFFLSFSLSLSISLSFPSFSLSLSLSLPFPLPLSFSLSFSPCFSSVRRHIAVGVVSTLIKSRHLIQQRDVTHKGRTNDRSVMAAATAAHH